MKKMIIFGFLCCAHYFAFAQTPANDPHWQLKWEDQFNSFNTSKWLKGEYGDHYGEPQLYRTSQVWTSNGNLVIEVINAKDTCPTPKPPRVGESGSCEPGTKYNYKSGWVETTPAYNVKFGYIEARIKLPYRAGKQWGFWPAFWTFSSGATNAAEIDIFEMFSGHYNNPNTLSNGIHRHYNFNEGYGISHEFSNFNYTDWHTYAIEWNADRIIWYLDGNAIRTLNSHSIAGPVRIILNLAIQKESKYLPPTSPPFQEYMYVDYVKVYQLRCDKNSVVTKITNFNTYDYSVKKSISLDNQTIIPANSNITLRATDFIELKPGFEVQTGRTLYLDVTPCEGGGTLKPPPERND